MTVKKPTTRNDEGARQLIGERLKEARKYLGLTQEDVAAYLKIPRTALVDIESGQRRVDALELSRLAQLYKQPTMYFTGEDVDASALPPSVAHIARKAAELSDGDQEELSRFVEYLQSRSRRKQK
jgi:transcriptional regulator with XRE-family HTH domain